VFQPYFSVKNNQGITVSAECHCPLMQALLIAELLILRHSVIYVWFCDPKHTWFDFEKVTVFVYIVKITDSTGWSVFTF